MPRSCETCPTRKGFATMTDMAPKTLYNDFDYKSADLTTNDIKIACDTLSQLHLKIEDNVDTCPGYRRFDIVAGSISYKSLISGQEFACRNDFVQRGNGEEYLKLMNRLIEHSGEIQR